MGHKSMKVAMDADWGWSLGDENAHGKTYYYFKSTKSVLYVSRRQQQHRLMPPLILLKFLRFMIGQQVRATIKSTLLTTKSLVLLFLKTW